MIVLKVIIHIDAEKDREYEHGNLENPKNNEATREKILVF